jgi:porphyrinogen peroxidase
LHFGSNGSYLVARQIHQYVDAFRKTVETSEVDRLGSKMMGRRMSAWPMVGGPLPASGRDDFLYLAADAPGFECPRGAHVRRAHPRDALAYTVDEGIQSSRLHRLLRRGRVYAESPGETSTGDGMMFVALNADLDRQFEFIQRNWILGSRFGDLSDEQDPILGVRPDRMFTVPGCPVGRRVGPLPRFTRVRGGGYFLLPGLRALSFMAGLVP